jgi:hypothetical protein
MRKRGQMHQLPGWLEEILAQPTTTVPQAGRALGIKGRNQSYEAAARGEIKTLRFGRRLSVPTAWLRRQLELHEGFDGVDKKPNGSSSAER